MCFLTVLRLAKLIEIGELEKLLKELGFEVVTRGRVLEARRGEAKLRAFLEKNSLKIETNDYGEQCLKDYENIYKGLLEMDAKPEAIHFTSPYVYAYEKKRGSAKKLLKKLGLEAEEVYSGYCG
jgi:predicted GNAT family acetyltransferase